MKKPNIELVYQAFHGFHVRMSQVGRDVSPFRQPKEWQAQADAAQEDLKKRLSELGLAEHIDWTNPNG